MMLLHNLMQASVWGSCSEAKLSLDLYSGEGYGRTSIFGSDITFQDFAFTSNGLLLVVEQ